MNVEVLVPELPESIADATLINWHKKPGERVEKGENLVDLETDKVVLEVPAPQTGILSKILKENGSTVIGRDLLALLEVHEETSDVMAEDREEQEQIQAREALAESPLSPAVRRLIYEHHLNPSEISGSGKSGRITKNDVLDFLQQQPEPQNDLAAELDMTAASAAAAETAEPGVPVAPAAITPMRPEQRVPMTRLRAKIAERLLQAQQNAAMLTTFNEVNMQSVIDLRNQYKARFAQKHNIKLGFMSFFVKASIEALKRFPIINASIDGNDIIYHGYYDIGIAVSTPRGLIVPVLRDADQLDFAGIEKNIADFGDKAGRGALTYEDLTGGTFTITNGGIFGSMLSTPLLNPPQSAILGMHAIRERAVVENGTIVVRPIMYLALSYDHRLIDGRDAVQFLYTIKECLESPAHLLLNI
ncbi:MAG: 2-oxoglutarate dehydrogenase complex dihydrolipoyllysine-residue succinyltransferase [Gammaproteobacteria bacterium]